VTCWASKMPWSAWQPPATVLLPVRPTATAVESSETVEGGFIPFALLPDIPTAVEVARSIAATGGPYSTTAGPPGPLNIYFLNEGVITTDQFGLFGLLTGPSTEVTVLGFRAAGSIIVDATLKGGTINFDANATLAAGPAGFFTPYTVYDWFPVSLGGLTESVDYAVRPDRTGIEPDAFYEYDGSYTTAGWAPWNVTVDGEVNTLNGLQDSYAGVPALTIPSSFSFSVKAVGVPGLIARETWPTITGTDLGTVTVAMPWHAVSFGGGSSHAEVFSTLDITNMPDVWSLALTNEFFSNAISSAYAVDISSAPGVEEEYQWTASAQLQVGDPLHVGGELGSLPHLTIQLPRFRYWIPTFLSGDTKNARITFDRGHGA
jgi:hypothetical protein